MSENYGEMSREFLIELIQHRDNVIELSREAYDRTNEAFWLLYERRNNDIAELLKVRKENREYVAIYREMDSEIVRLRTERANLLKQVREIQDKYERALSTGDHYSECLRKAEERSFELENENDKLADENEKLNGQIESIKKVVAW